MATIHIHGYSDRISVKAGDRIRFMVSVEGAQLYRAEIVRLINGDSNPVGPGPKEQSIETSVTGEYSAQFQPIDAGSHVVVDDREGLLNLGTAISVHAFIMPTTPPKGAQGIVTHWDNAGRKGWAFMIDDSGRLTFLIGDGQHLIQATAPAPLIAAVWYAAGGSYDGAAGRALIYLAPVVNPVNSTVGRVASLPAPLMQEVEAERINFHCDWPSIIAGWAVATTNVKVVVDGHYNGKIDRPMVYGRALGPAEFASLAQGREIDGRGLLARWDFADGIGADGIATDNVTDTSGNDLHGQCVNAPARAVTGHNWRGREEHFVHAPAEYGAIHFHDDDVEDAGWNTSFELSIPETMGSAIYAAKLTAGDARDYIPFAVRPQLGKPTAKIAFLMPTASYMAYSNAISGFAQNALQPVLGHTIVLTPEDIYLYEHPELGLSTYGNHSDGSGVC
jgi:N,N-dimethylformamidase